MSEDVNIGAAVTILQGIAISRDERRVANKIIMNSLIEIKGSPAKATMWMKDKMALHPEACQLILMTTTTVTPLFRNSLTR